MFRLQPRLTKFFLPLALVGIHAVSSEALAQKITEKVSYAPPTVGLTADKAVVNAGDNAVIKLTAHATSPSNNTIRYVWRVTGGQIEGEGPTVTWNLAGAGPGQHKAYLVITTGNGDEVCEALTNTMVTVKSVTIKPTCPSVGIACPEQARVGQPVTFSSTLTGGSGNVPAIYNWTVSGGKIISGQGSSSITVDTTGMEGQTLRASLTMGGYEEECAATCAIYFPAPLIGRRFDEYPEIARNDEKARLDNFTIELQTDPTATGYVIIYPGPQERASTIQTRSKKINDYMVNSRGFDPKRIVTLVGPPRNELTVELWVRPQGAAPPTP